MKNIRQNITDSLRPEYKRSDFGELVRGKHTFAEIDFSELVSILIACIGEDEGLKFVKQSSGNSERRKTSDWTYHIDNNNRITLRYWLSEVRSIDESFSNPRRITTPQERSDLQNLLAKHVRTLVNKVDAL